MSVNQVRELPSKFCVPVRNFVWALDFDVNCSLILNNLQGLLHLWLQVGVSMQGVMLGSGGLAGMKLSRCNTQEHRNNTLSAGLLGYWATGLFSSDLPLDVL